MTDANLQQRVEELHRKVDLLLQEVHRAHARFLGVADAAGLTGLSAVSIRRLLAAGRLTALRPVRGKILIDRRELETMVRASTATPRTGRGLTGK